jgi:hypothetical protein
LTPFPNLFYTPRMKQLQVIVTGTGRSGTVYFANLLTRVGIPCGHESLFTPWGLDEAIARLEGRHGVDVSAISRESCGEWCPNPQEVVADSSYMAAPWLDQDLLKEVPVIHVVRHPLKVINSFVVGLNYFKDWVPADVWHHFMYTHIPELRLDYTPLERAALYYVRWNQMIERKASNRPYLFCQLEHITEKLFDFLGVTCPDDSVLGARNVNSRMVGKSRHRFEEIPEGPIRDELEMLAERYGYRLRPKPPTPPPSLWGRMHKALSACGLGV